MEIYNTTASMVLGILVLLLYNIMNGSSTSPEFQQLSGCTCPGYGVEYMCTAIGIGGFTHYGGTAFHCELSGDEIVLLHTDYDRGITKNCTRISARSLRVTNGHYKSQLLISNISQELNGQSVICGYSDGTTDSVTVIRTILIRITTDPPSQPIVQLLDIKSEKLIFGWNPPIVNCSALHYVISSTGCGHCTDGFVTFSSSVTCSIVAAATDPRMCRFAVRSVVCDNISSLVSNRVDVQLKVAEPPEIIGAVARYAESIDGLSAIDIYFTEVSPFNITNEVEGSPLYYTVIYTESNTGLQCGSFDILSFSACNHGICLCSISLPSSCFHLSGVIMISLSATNILGRGLSNSFDISTTNVYFDVKLSSDSVVCTFSGTQSQQLKSCSITYGPCQQQESKNATKSDITDPVQLTLSTELKNGDCYFWDASNGTFTVLQKGIYYQRQTESDSPFKLAFIVTVTVTVLATVIIILLIIIIILLLRTYTKKGRKWKLTAAIKNVMRSKRDHKPVLLERDDESDAIFISLRDKPGQLRQALKVFKESEIDLLDTKIVERKHGYGKLRFLCDESLSNDKVDHIKQQLEIIAKEEIPALQNTGQQMIYSQSFPPTCGSLYKFMEEVEDIGSINIADINVRPTSDDSTNRKVTLKFYGESGYPKNWKEKFDKVYADQMQA